MFQQWTGGSSWETILHAGSSGFAVMGVGPAGVFIGESGSDYEYDGTPDAWTRISSFPLSVVAVSRTHVYGATFDADSSNPTSVSV